MVPEDLPFWCDKKSNNAEIFFIVPLCCTKHFFDEKTGFMEKLRIHVIDDFIPLITPSLFSILLSHNLSELD